MKDQHDKQTLDALGARRRGRPVTGKAKPASQRQAEYRRRQRKRLDLVWLGLDDLSNAHLCDALKLSLTLPKDALGFTSAEILAELSKRVGS